MPRPKGLRAPDEVIPKLGVRPGLPALRVGDVAAYDRAIEHAAGQLDRGDLEVPLRFAAARHGLVLCFALEACDVGRLLRELVRVAHPDGAVWVVVWKKPFRRAGAPAWDQMQAAGLATGWVDNKELSFGDECYGTRFVRRRNPPGAPAS
ncbi:MAG TPA: hypothetical protein VFM93_01670 [Candidatus Limnocylindria bacterium]|nr:hypothetical protein [Candidatus Limnocylindria bacterium]